MSSEKMSAEILGRYDVVVAGARCAGAATALLLARAGLRVLAVDRQTYGSDTLSTHALMRGAVVQLSRWGLLDRLAAAGTPAVRRTTFHYGDESFPIALSADHGVDALYAPRRTVLDRILVDAGREAGADIRHGAVVTSLLTGRGGRVTGVSLRDAAGMTREVAADIVVGADGRHSFVAKSVGARFTRVAPHRTAAVFGYFSGMADKGFRWYYRPGVSVGAIPTNDGLTCVFASLPPDRFRREMDSGAEALFGRILREASPELASGMARTVRCGRLRGFPGEAGFFRQSHGAGWALVGDAGYFKDPLTAHGITDALRDAELLATAIVVGGGEADMRDYRGLRDALSADLFEVTDEIASFAWDLETLKHHHKRLNAAMKAETASIAAFAGTVPLAA